MGGGASARRATVSAPISRSENDVGRRYSGIQPPGKDAAVRPQIYSMPTPGTSGARDADITKVTFPLSDASHALGEVTDTSAKSEGAFPSKSPPGSQIVDEVAGEASDLATSSRKEDVAYTVVPRRREEFHTLQEEVQKKRSDGMSYGEIFNQYATRAKEMGVDRMHGVRHRRRATQGGGPQKGLIVSTPTLSEIAKFRTLTVSKCPEAIDKDAIFSDDKASAVPVRDRARPRQSYLSKQRSLENLRKRSSETPMDGQRPTGLGEQHGAASSDNVHGHRMSFWSSPPMRTTSTATGPPADNEQVDTHPSQSKPSRRAQIFDKGVDALTMQDLLNDDVDGEDGTPGGGLGRSGLLAKQELMGAQATDIVIGALQKFFFLDDGPHETHKDGKDGEQSEGMSMLLGAMEREEREAGASLMEQGEEGKHMFVVEEGSLEVIIDDEAVRVIGVGDRVGELALVYNAPRSASVRTLSSCVLWSIHRDLFKAVQALTASGALTARSTYLYHVPWLRLLGTTDLSKIAACFSAAQYKAGDVILRQGEETDRCFLIDSGEVICSAKVTHAAACRDDDEDSSNLEGAEICRRVERLMMVARPGTRQSRTPGIAVGVTSRPESVRHSLQDANVVGDYQDGRSARPASRQGRPKLSRQEGKLDIGGVNGIGATLSECEPHWNEERGEVQFDKGCFLGVPVLLASAELEIDGLPGWEVVTPSPVDRQQTDVGVDHEAPRARFAALSPVQIVASGEVRIGHFDVAKFAKTVGPFAKVLGSNGAARVDSPFRSVRDRASVSRQSLLANPGEGAILKRENLSIHSFERIEFLGQGSFGNVTMVRKKEGAMEGALFALKSLSKLAIVEGGQLQHIKDEKTVLEMFNHPFVLRLFTTFQDSSRVYFLTEVLRGGELWSIIYESSSGFEAGLPPDHVQFYSAIVVDALAYMHEKGIAYRDLKPENLVIDDDGYLRIIDMGFAKQIPFFVTVAGQTQMHPRSHTMCGTPEYLAPEFIFNKGHDQSVDLWALGVLIFEMVEARTPFAAAGEEQDIAKLFTKIACVKKGGVEFPEHFDQRAGGCRCRHMIAGMLAFEPTDRLGNLANGMDDVKGHSVYETLLWDELEAKLTRAPWIPDGPAGTAEADEASTSDDVYTGNQEHFATF